MVSRIVIVVAAAALAMPSAAAPPARRYTVARVGSAIDGAEVVGTKRAGAMCLPNGTIRWGEVADSTQLDQREVVQDTLEDAGIALTPLGIGSEQATRLRGVVRSARFTLCARGWGLRGSKAMSGDATLTVEWRLEGADAAVSSHVSTVSRQVDAHHAAPAGAIYRLLLVDAARDAATWLNGGDDTRAGAASF